MALKIDPDAIAEKLGATGDDPDSEAPAKDDEGSMSDLEAAMGDLIDALDSKDPKAAAVAFKHAMELVDSET